MRTPPPVAFREGKQSEAKALNREIDEIKNAIVSKQEREGTSTNATKLLHRLRNAIDKRNALIA